MGPPVRADRIAEYAGRQSAILRNAEAKLLVTFREAAAVAKLPLHHSDPFDRLLLAKAFLEPLRLVTADSVLAAYGGAIELI